MTDLADRVANTPRLPGPGFWKRVGTPLAIALSLWFAMLAIESFLGTPRNDFGRIRQSAVFWWAGEDMYDWFPELRVSVCPPYSVDGKAYDVDLWNLNPPHTHLLFLPLALLSPRVAFIVWLAASPAAAVTSLILIFRAAGVSWTPGVRRWVLCAFLGNIATHELIFTGQVSWLLWLPVTWLWLEARRGRWVRAGAWLGIVVSLKPFLLILVPYLVMRRHLTALAAAAATTAASFGIGWLVFGAASHRSWIACLGKTDNWAWFPMNASLWGVFARTFRLNPFCAPLFEVSSPTLKLAWLVVVGLLGLVTMVIAVTDRSPERVDRAFALLMIGSLLFSPLGWVYYLFLPVGPVFTVVAGWWRQPATGPLAVWRWRLLALALPGLFFPVPWVLPYQASVVGTLVLGDMRTWCLLCVWLALVLDGLPHVAIPLAIRTRLPTTSRARPLQPALQGS